MAGLLGAPLDAIDGRTATEAFRQEAGPHLRVTDVSPGFVDTDFAGSTGDPAVRAAIETRKKAFAKAPNAIARAVVFAIEQPADVKIGSMIVCPTAQD